MEKAKEFYRSKRFWTLAVALVSGIGLIVTGEQSLTDALPEILTTALIILGGFLGMATNTPIAFGSKVIGKK
jgi:uncharacterized membrane protein YccC